MTYLEACTEVEMGRRSMWRESFLTELLNSQLFLSSGNHNVHFKILINWWPNPFLIGRDILISTVCLWKRQHRKRKWKGKESWPANPIWPTQDLSAGSLIPRQEPHPQRTTIIFHLEMCMCVHTATEAGAAQSQLSCPALSLRPELWNESHHLDNWEGTLTVLPAQLSREEPCPACSHRAGADTSSRIIIPLFPGWGRPTVPWIITL